MIVNSLYFWGTAEKDEKPFRAWYGNLKEMRSLVTRHTGFMAFTATATKSTKQKIYELLQLSLNSTAVVEKSPCKDNLRFAVKYMERDRSFDSIFGWLINDFMLNSIKTERTLIYCQTRKQCSLIYRYFSVKLAAAPWKHEGKLKGKRVIEMFHAGTPETVKKHVITELSDGHSCLRVVICTVAFGMGINCVDFTRVFNFGPPRNMEEYIQMCGRAGRKGEESICILLHNGLLCSHSNLEIKSYVATDNGRRKELQKHFPQTGLFHDSGSLQDCECCDNCSIKCSCGAGCKKELLQFHFIDNDQDVVEEKDKRTRNVTQE